LLFPELPLLPELVPRLLHPLLPWSLFSELLLLAELVPWLPEPLRP
jgi:hypothetical protein